MCNTIRGEGPRRGGGQNDTLLRIDSHRNSVMQSDGNSFCGDVVLDSFNKASREEDNI